MSGHGGDPGTGDLATDGDDALMTEEHKRLIRSKTDVLQDTLDLNPTLLARLRSRNILLPGDVSRINDAVGDSEKVQVFLTILLRKPDGAFRELILALRDPNILQAHVARILDPNREVQGNVRPNNPPAAPGTPQAPQGPGLGGTPSGVQRNYPSPANNVSPAARGSPSGAPYNPSKYANQQDTSQEDGYQEEPAAGPKHTPSARKGSGATPQASTSRGEQAAGVSGQGDDDTPRRPLQDRLQRTVRVRAGIEDLQELSDDDDAEVEVDFPELTPRRRRHRALDRQAALDQTICREIKEATLLEVRNLKRIARQGVTNNTVKQREIILKSLRELQELQREVLDTVDGSVVYIVMCPTIEALTDLKAICDSGKLRSLIERDFVTEAFKRKYHLRSLTLFVELPRDEFKKCRAELRGRVAEQNEGTVAASSREVISPLPHEQNAEWSIDSPQTDEEVVFLQEVEEQVNRASYSQGESGSSPDSIASSGIFSCGSVASPDCGNSNSNSNSSSYEVDPGIMMTP